MKSAAFLAVLTLIPFSRAQAESDREIVRVNGTPIRQSEIFERLWKRYGPETLDEMIDEILMRQTAAARGIKAEPSEIDLRLARLRGQFPDPKVFENQLQQSGMSLERLRQEIADETTREELVIRERRISVKDDELKKAFAEHREQLGAPPSVHLRHILVAAEAEARDIVSKVEAGADFAALAREKSLAPTGKLNGGDYGFVTRGSLPPSR